MKPKVSVIIPTHNRPETLGECLRCLEKQTIADAIEVIIINDVQDDKEIKRLANSSWQIPVYFETIAPCHQGVARNQGVTKAQSSTVLFIGDDIYLTPKACELHLRAHEHGSTPVAVLGDIDWDPSVGMTKVMKWLMTSGWQFGFNKIKQFRDDFIPESMQHLFSYTSNISVPTEVAARLPFREDVKLYGWEDMEWGMRLQKNGVRLYYEPRAKGLHHHRINLPDSLKRMEVIGASAAVMAGVVEGFDRLPRGWKRLAYSVLAMLPTMAGKHRKAFLRGIRKK
ncbi:MAG: glycosyltransferase [Candidatus Peregrinibacteria bacterium]|nr:glycosyltransferase [Candidatus Peregrinibacteria bacterium]MCB9807946.1 glycosyltransferase [Candidatus Peribacteria bacterium]